jgi:glycosyltransferase involved in cell wall biosynthesis
MACGLPAVAARAGGVLDSVEDGVNGILVPPADAESIAAAIVVLHDDPARRLQLGHAARNRVMENFSMESMTNKTIDLYRACLDGPARNHHQEANH